MAKIYVKPYGKENWEGELLRHSCTINIVRLEWMPELLVFSSKNKFYLRNNT